METIVSALATALGDGIGWLADHFVLFAVFLVIWAAFAAALLMSQGSLDQAWQSIRGLPLVAQLVVWVLFLPVMVGFWIWEASGWPVAVRLVLVVGVAAWNLFMFLPRASTATPA